MQRKKKDLLLFLAASALIGVSQSIDSSVFNNFLSDTFHLTVAQRTILEFPREFPGFIVVFVSAMLVFLCDVRIAALANLLAAFGMLALGFLSTDFGIMMIWLGIYSLGQHLFMPVSNSIGMSLADDEKNIGQILGKINGVNTAVFLLTSLLTAFIFRFVRVNYRVAFSAGALAYLGATLLIFLMAPQQKKREGRKLFLRKEYSLFYWLNVVYGARKQIFITFGPWVLIKIFGQGVSTFAVLGFIVSGTGIFFKPFVGHLIDKKGERFVLTAEAMILVMICLGYAFAKSIARGIGFASLALGITSVCFVLDQLLIAAGMARATYLRKIAVNSDDISSTLSMGITLDHAVSMTLPWLGSLVWDRFGYEYVFIGGALIALLNLMLAREIKDVGVQKKESTLEVSP